jgi:hypothetical protein
MKQWFKIIIKNGDGTHEGTEVVKAESKQEAIAEIKDEWEECTFEIGNLTYEEQEECDRCDAVKAFMEDNCTKDEAKRFIKAGGEAIKASEWEQYVRDNDLRNEDGAYITLDEIRSERDVHTVEFDGEEYILLYVL